MGLIYLLFFFLFLLLVFLLILVIFGVISRRSATIRLDLLDHLIPVLGFNT